MKNVYCANCGTRLSIYRKALPKYATIIDIVEFHKCPKEPVELDLKPIDIPKFSEDKVNNKFVQSLNELQPTPRTVFDTMNIKDHRSESDIKSTAPKNILRSLNLATKNLPLTELDLESED